MYFPFSTPVTLKLTGLPTRDMMAISLVLPVSMPAGRFAAGDDAGFLPQLDGQVVRGVAVRRHALQNTPLGNGALQQGGALHISAVFGVSSSIPSGR